MRADCYVAMKDLFKAVGDVRPLTKLIPDNTGAYLQLSHLYYVMGEADTSLKYVGFVPVLPAFILLRSSCALHPVLTHMCACVSVKSVNV